MAGLDTRGLAAGFQQGFGMMDRYYNRQEQNKRANERLEMAKKQDRFQRYDANRRASFQEDKFEYGKEQDERNWDWKERKFDYQQEIDDKKLDMQQQRIGLSRQRVGLQQARFAHQKAEAERQRQKEQDLQLINSAYATMAEGGDVTEEQMAALERNPAYNPMHIADPRMTEAVQIAESVVDPNSSMDLNNPEALGALNFMFRDRINRGEGGEKRIVAAYPGKKEGTITFELAVKGKDGKERNEPMTEGRGTGKDEKVMQVPVERLVEHAQGYRMLNRLSETPQFQQSVSRFAQRMGVSAGGPMQPPEITERTKERLKILSNRADTLREKQANGFGLTTEEKAELGEIEEQQQALLGGTNATGGDLADLVADELEGIDPQGGGQRGQGGEDNASAREKIDQSDQQAEQEQRELQHRDTTSRTVDQVDKLIESMEAAARGGKPEGGLSGLSRLSGDIGKLQNSDYQVDPKSLKQGEKLVQKLMKLHDDPRASTMQKNQIMEAIDRLRNAGVSVPKQ